MGLETLLGLVVMPTVLYLKKVAKFLDELPIITFIIVGLLSYGMTVVYVGFTTGIWAAEIPPETVEIIKTQMLIAIGLKTGHKTYKNLIRTNGTEQK